MRIAHLIRGLAAHLANNEHCHGDDEGITGDNRNVQLLVRNALIICSQHVPHEQGPHQGIDKRPAKDQAPAWQG